MDDDGFEKVRPQGKLFKQRRRDLTPNTIIGITAIAVSTPKVKQKNKEKDFTTNIESFLLVNIHQERRS